MTARARLSRAPGPSPAVRARAPGRVNLIGDHTDYTGGLALPMAINLHTIVTFSPDGSDRVRLASDLDPSQASVEVPVAAGRASMAAVEPAWARYVTGVAAAADVGTGGSGTVRSTVPMGAGLSSSAALEVAVALALGFQGSELELAKVCQLAERLAVGVPCGLMDQLTSVSGVAGHALLIDFTGLEVTPVPLPGDVEVFAVHSGRPRRLASSAYAKRRLECEAAARVIGPLASAAPDTLSSITDPVIRRRARHVLSENQRVLSVTAALRSGDLAAVGKEMSASHTSLARDFQVSTPEVDELVVALGSIPGVWGSRLTGAGFGGCVVALARPGAIDPERVGTRAWRLDAAGGASVEALAAT